MWNSFKQSIKKFTHKFIKTGFSLGKKLKNLFSGKVDSELLEEFEKILFEADLGADLALRLKEKLKDKIQKNPDLNSNEILAFLKTELLTIFEQTTFEQKPAENTHPDQTASSKTTTEITKNSPYVIMLVGTNGSGKTTTLAKLANHYKKQKKKLLIAAADTFRSAAVEQLAIWAKSLDCDIIKSRHGADPAAVVFDAMEAAKNRQTDIILIDTAGRLQNKTELMQELDKIKRILHKKQPGSPHETLLTIDATVGQNGLDQAELFNEFTPLTGIILTKFDGTAKGGIVVAIEEKLHIPIKWVGTGEKIDDLIAFDAKTYVEELLF